MVKSNGEDPGQFKIYKEICYPNSEGNPFGLTINGRSKEYINAHEAFKDMIIKGKKYSGNAHIELNSFYQTVQQEISITWMPWHVFKIWMEVFRF